MKTILIFIFVTLSLSSPAIVVDQFLCTIHVYTEDNIPLEITATPTVVRVPYFQQNDLTITKGEFEFSGVAKSKDDEFEVRFKHTYFHSVFQKSKGQFEARQCMNNELGGQNVGAYQNSCPPNPYDKNWPWDKVPLNSFPQYQMGEKSFMTLNAHGVLIQGGCDLLKSEEYL